MTEEKKTIKYPRMGGNDVSDVYVVRKPRYSEGLPVGMIVHHQHQVDPRGTFALLCIERWAMVAAEENGEDSAGRMKLRRMTPDEIVAHACECSERAFSKFEEKGWLVKFPNLQEAIEAVQDIENSND